MEDQSKIRTEWVPEAYKDQITYIWSANLPPLSKSTHNFSKVPLKAFKKSVNKK